MNFFVEELLILLFLCIIFGLAIGVLIAIRFYKFMMFKIDNLTKKPGIEIDTFPYFEIVKLKKNEGDNVLKHRRNLYENE